MNDLWTIVTKKTDGEMYQRVINTPGRDGFLAYWRIHHWCTCCSGESRQGLRTAVMTPDPVKRDEDVPAAIEKWEGRESGGTEAG